MLPTIVAHRGDAEHFPENSLPAIEAAWRRGLGYVEFDVQLSADGVPYLIHDANLERTTGAAGDLRLMMSGQLDGIDAGEPARFGRTHAGTTLPRLAAVVELMAGIPEARAFVEVKRASLVHHGHAHCIERILAALGPVLDRCSLISFDADACRLARTAAGAAIGWVLDDDPSSLQKELEAMSPEYVFCDHRRLPAGGPLPSGPWTWVVYEVIDAGLAVELEKRGVEMVESMAPFRLAEALAARESRSAMTGRLHIAIDQGGHATRASAYDATGSLEGAALVTIATQRNALGHVEHDPEEVVASARTALAELARIAPVSQWESAGFAVQRSSLVCWDANDGRALTPIISWQDTRNANWLKGLERRSDDVQRLTGLPLSPHYGGSKLRWCLDHLPEVRSAAAQSRLHAGPLACYLLHRLLRERPFIADASTAARTLLWSPFERGWSTELLELFGIPRTILPRAAGTPASSARSTAKAGLSRSS